MPAAGLRPGPRSVHRGHSAREAPGTAVWPCINTYQPSEVTTWTGYDEPRCWLLSRRAASLPGSCSHSPDLSRSKPLSTRSHQEERQATRPSCESQGQGHRICCRLCSLLVAFPDASLVLPILAWRVSTNPFQKSDSQPECQGSPWADPSTAGTAGERVAVSPTLPRPAASPSAWDAPLEKAPFLCMPSRAGEAQAWPHPGSQGAALGSWPSPEARQPLLHPQSGKPSVGFVKTEQDDHKNPHQFCCLQVRAKAAGCGLQVEVRPQESRTAGRWPAYLGHREGFSESERTQLQPVLVEGVSRGMWVLEVPVGHLN